MKYLKKIQYNSPVILTYSLVSFLVLILDFFTKDLINNFFMIYYTNFKDILLYLRLFTHILGHTNFEHFFNNFLIILLIGPILEEKYGSKNILKNILITALITGLFHIIFSKDALLGASGVAFMLISLVSFVNIKNGKVPITIILFFIIYMGKEFYYLFLFDDNISRFTHILGGICGIFFGIFLNNDKNI